MFLRDTVSPPKNYLIACVQGYIVYTKSMPKGIKGFQKGHKSFVSKDSYKVIGKKTRKRMFIYKGVVPPWLVGKSLFVKGHKINDGEKHWAWKGDKVGRTALHDWVKHRLGRPNKCAVCKTTTAKKYEWANLSREYKRDLRDWKRMCVSCHRKYDGHAIKMWVTRRKKKLI